MTKTIDTAVPSQARVEALQAILRALAVRPLAVPAWMRDQCRARLSKALASKAETSADRRAA